MEEDIGVKAPVTRLRRRLSVEQPDDVKSPGPATPTKKRGGRLAAKPQLDLIEENAPTPGSASKRTTRRTSAVKDIIEAEEKPVTPSRRSTRIKSNTSIVSETTTQSFDSPRAKRAAARRTSQVEVTLASKPSNITEIIIEETESSSVKSDETVKGTETTTEISPTRRSPRIKEKKQVVKKSTKKTDSKSSDAEELNRSSSKENIESNENQSEFEVKESEVVESKSVSSPEKSKHNISDSSLLLIKELNNMPKKNSSNLNKTTSALVENGFKSKRPRTKSLVVSSDTHVDEGMFYSDNESVKKKNSKKQALNKSKNDSVNLADGVLNTTSTDIPLIDQELQNNTSVQQNLENESSFSTTKIRKSKGSETPNKSLNSSNNAVGAETVSPRGNKENIPEDSIETIKIFEKAPTTILSSTVFFEDSDTDSKGKGKKIPIDTEDQCVPVVDNKLVEEQITGPSESNKQDNNDSLLNKINTKNIDIDDGCEPMDVDETIPNDVTLNDFSQNNLNQTSDSKAPTVEEQSVANSNILNKSSNKSRRKSSISVADTQNLEKNNDITLNEFSQNNLNHTSDGKTPTVQVLSVANSPQVDISLNKSLNKSRRKSSISVADTQNLEKTNDITVNELSQNNLNQTSDTKNPTVQALSVANSSQVDNSLNKSSNKSRRKSSISVTENLEKTENKSTLILSQIKDISSTEHNTSKSPKSNSDQLNKSACPVNVVNDKAIDKKNVSQDYSTSTPLQQKKFQKLGMQINSSIIDTSNIESKDKKVQNKSKNDLSQIAKSPETTSEEESEDEVDSSRPRNSFLDDEAEVASDDYESGDSQDEDERQYEDENEFIEKGETLDSDDEVSNDTDYEKDSFVVSSDEEDDDLLSGSGDDLSMSDNELTMSKKSKKKYDERKLKEQKKASREMYEARHKLDTSDTALRRNKSKRQKIESSEESSDEENIVPVVKRNKLRLDSSQDESFNNSNANNSKLVRKAKRKRLSESVCDENANTEQEISVSGENLQKPDPLSVQVKLEPKTPMKDMNISTVQIHDNIEEVCVNNNMSIIKSSDTVDPLQATMLEEDSSSLSESSEIVNNYDSILKKLNDDKKTKTLKSRDMSLNLDKKTKQKKQPLIDQLNITNTKKKSKKNKKLEGIDVVDSAEKEEKQPVNEFEESSSSDCIDLQLLFSEDSCDIDVSQKSPKKTDSPDTEEAEDYIPLKRTPGKMNILTQNDELEANKSQLNESVKHNKSKSKGLIEETADTVANNNDIHIIIDTKGTHKSADKSMNNSLSLSNKKKNKKNNVSFKDDAEISMFNETGNNEDEILPNEEKRKKKNKKSMETAVEDTPIVNTNTEDDDAPEEIMYQSTKSKKGRKSSDAQVGDEPAMDEIQEPEQCINISLNVNSAKKKKMKKSLQAEQSSDGNDTPVVDKNVSIGSAKKQKHKSSDHSLIAVEADGGTGEDKNVSMGSAKNQKNKAANNTQITLDEAEKSINLSAMTDSTKKKKKKLSMTHDDDQVETEPTNIETHNISIGSTKKKKQKDKPDESVSVEETGVQNVETPKENSKKRKRKSSTNLDTNLIRDEGEQAQQTLNDSIFIESQKKKRKISQNDENTQSSDAEKIAAGSQKKKTKSLAFSEDSKQNQDPEPKKKSKKRKERDEDEGNNVSKIFKENSFDKVHISRLPSSILSQLDDKPKKAVLEMKKSSLVSTTPFIVEDTRKRRSKPSTFLEESVYLNDTHTEKKQKANIKKPKVLPFIPTAVTSGSGFTTNFKINIIPTEVKFVAQTKNVSNFKTDYLYSKKIKRMGTYESYKKHRSAKMSKF
ncbi:kinesin-related protein 4-like isoform X2 [Ostrinia nubilalis]|uniref:kinesin-related protein 4-like isoform X2 n=1 Tax=Ostrinia nubilalis TaxID=29057 RepID=UPI003082670B